MASVIAMYFMCLVGFGLLGIQFYITMHARAELRDETRRLFRLYQQLRVKRRLSKQ